MTAEIANSILEVFLAGVCIYPPLILVLRLTGKRTLSKMNAFDLVVTIALGSAISSTLLDSKVSAWKGFAAVFFLVIAQFTVAWIAARSHTFSRLIKAYPAMLLRDGKFIEGALNRERVSREEVLAAIRFAG